MRLPHEAWLVGVESGLFMHAHPIEDVGIASCTDEPEDTDRHRRRSPARLVTQGQRGTSDGWSLR